MQLGQRSSTNESAESVASTDTLPTIAQTTNKADSIPKHKTKVTTGPAALIINLPETENIQQDLQLVRKTRSHRAGMQEQAAARALPQQAKGAQERIHG